VPQTTVADPAFQGLGDESIDSGVAGLAARAQPQLRREDAPPPSEAAQAVLAQATPAVAGFDSTRSHNIPYLIGVDHLRAGAALLILYYHGLQLFSSEVRHHRMFQPSDWLKAPDPFSALLLEGHSAVALFICLSGFIFAFGAAGRQVTYRQFLTNRFLRTYPLFLFVVMVGCAVYQPSVQLSALLQLVLGGANLHGAQWFGDFSAMLWSVSLEWQLYLLFPALMAVLNGSGRTRILGLLALLLVARALAFSAGMHPVYGLYTQVLGRLDQFVLGMLAGHAYALGRTCPERRGAFRRFLLPALVGLLFGAYAFNQRGGWPVFAWWKIATPSIEGVLWTALILGYISWTDRQSDGPGTLARSFAAIGATSYSIYLWHFALIQTQRTRGWLPHWIHQPELNAVLVVTLTTLPATLLFAALSYQVIEKPFLALRRRYVAADAQLARAGA
jgi:peptidoglycan/LPS O-acetylase OafA/YrhL